MGTGGLYAVVEWMAMRLQFAHWIISLVRHFFGIVRF